MEFRDLRQPENQRAGGPPMMSASDRAAWYALIRHAQIETVLVEESQRGPQAYYVELQVQAQPLTDEAVGVARQAEQDCGSPLLAVRSVFGSPGAAVEDRLYVPTDSEHLKRFGALTLAEEFPR